MLSSKSRKLFRFGNNWVKLGIVIQLPFRRDRYSCLPVLWRVYEKKSNKKPHEHRTKSQLAAEVVTILAKCLPARKIIVLGDSAYVGQYLLKDRQNNVEVISPIRWDAALTEPPDPQSAGRRKKGKPPADSGRDARR